MVDKADTDSILFRDFTDRAYTDTDTITFGETQSRWYEGIQAEYTGPFEAEIETIYANAIITGNQPSVGDTMADWYMGKGDTFPAIPVQLTQNGEPVDLTGATVQFKMRLYGKTIVLDSATVTSESTGEVEYEWSAGDTDYVGLHEGSWIVTYSDDTIQTFPNKGFNLIQIRQT